VQTCYAPCGTSRFDVVRQMRKIRREARNAGLIVERQTGVRRNPETGRYEAQIAVSK
jgi:hypothetical protein